MAKTNAIDSDRQSLRLWHHRARCARTQPQARRLWRGLRPHLTEGEARVLATAWSQAVADEGPRELDSAANSVYARMQIDVATRRAFDDHERRSDRGRISFWQRVAISRALGPEAEREARAAQAITEIRRRGKLDHAARAVVRAIPYLPDYAEIVRRVIG